jgi:hypothetical protein
MKCRWLRRRWVVEPAPSDGERTQSGMPPASLWSFLLFRRMPRGENAIPKYSRRVSETPLIVPARIFLVGQLSAAKCLRLPG